MRKFLLASALLCAAGPFVTSMDAVDPLDTKLLTEPAVSASHIAFSASYDGNVDVFTVPVTGGAPVRLTWHPGADVVQAFTPDGKAILFTS
jgi:tricorn protease